MQRAAKRQKRSSSRQSLETLTCMAPSPAPAAFTACNTTDPVLGVPLKGVAREELVELQSPCVLAWAPALMWLWISHGRSAHPQTMQPLAPEEEEAVVRAALKASAGSSAGPADFLLFRSFASAPAPAEKDSALRAHLASHCQRPPTTSTRLPTVLAEQLDIVKETVLQACTLDAVQEVQRSVQSLSVGDLWLYDALWGQLVRLDAPLALSRMLQSALPAFREALAQSWGFHPLVLAPIVRHFVFLEEYVCRAALGTLQTPGPWRYESFAGAVYRPLPHSRGQHRTGFAQWPLGYRSEVFVVPSCSANQLAYVEAALEECPLVEASAAPPAPESATTTTAAPPAYLRTVSAASSSSILALLQREMGEDSLLSGAQLFNNAHIYHMHSAGPVSMSLGQLIGLQPSADDPFNLPQQLLEEAEQGEVAGVSAHQGSFHHFVAQPLSASQPYFQDEDEEEGMLESEDGEEEEEEEDEEDDDVIY